LKTLVLGLGNTILTDDGVGVYVARALGEDHRKADVDFAEASVGGLRLLDFISGYERVVMVDAIQTLDGQPGDIYALHPDDLRVPLHTGSSHDLTLPGALALGRGMNLPLPRDEDFVIIAIEVEDVLTFGEKCSPAVVAAIPRAVEAVLHLLETKGAEHSF
jgi:hydrogenase maturation protease